MHRRELSAPIKLVKKAKWHIATPESIFAETESGYSTWPKLTVPLPENHYYPGHTGWLVSGYEEEPGVLLPSKRRPLNETEKMLVSCHQWGMCPTDASIELRRLSRVEVEPSEIIRWLTTNKITPHRRSHHPVANPGWAA